ncbi:MAG: BatA domain-containing protein [Verrucomicrobiales bacterium]|nr:BatA domain-containing protein [Verrucomicrobiales bacterium]
MSFLGIGFLLGLVGIILPLAIHFFGKRRKVIQPWGAMRFLDEAKPNWKRRSLRLQDILILLLRIGAVALLALAFARPALQTPLPLESAHEIVIITDRSLSTELVSGVSGEILKKTGRALDQIPAETKVHFYIGRNKVPPASGEPFNSEINRKAWLAALEKSPTTSDTPDWTDTIRLASNRANDGQSLSRQILVIADASRHGWPAPESEVWKQLISDLKKTSLYLAPIGIESVLRKQPNLCVDQVVPGQFRIQTGKEVTVKAIVTNRGTTPAREIVADWKSGNEATPLSSLPIPALEPGASHEVVFKRAFPEPGPVAIRLDLKNPSGTSPVDDTAATVIDIVDQISVVVFTDQSPDRTKASDASFANWAFAAAAGHPESLQKKPISYQPLFHLEWLPADALANTELGRYDVVVWSVDDFSKLSPETVHDSLRQFVEEGGGLWFRPSRQVNTTDYNRTFFPHEFGLSPAGLTLPRDLSEAAIGLRPADQEDLSPLASIAFAALDELQVKGYLETTLPLPASSESLLEFAGGKSFVIRRSIGKGEVILTTLDSNPESGNLAACVGYVPYVREMLWKLASSRSPNRNFKPGEFAINEIRIDRPGLHLTENGQPISVSRIPEESNLESLTRLEADRLDRIEGLELLDSQLNSDLNRLSTRLTADDPSKKMERPVQTREIWSWLLLGLLGFLVFEVLLAHQLLSRRRAATR